MTANSYRIKFSQYPNLSISIFALVLLPSCQAPHQVESGVLLFASSSLPEGHQQILVMDSDGGNAKALTTGEGTHAWPVWSPDGKRIAFDSNRDGNWDVYVMNADGSDVKRLSQDPALDRLPSWSQDGKQILFHSNRDGNWEIYVMSSSGENVKRLTRDPGNDLDAVWSPDGRKILFVSNRTGMNLLYTMNPDGSGVECVRTGPLTSSSTTPLAPNEASHSENRFHALVSDNAPSWSADGTRVAFCSPRDGNRHVYVINADGSGEVQLTHGKHNNGYPFWSHDGSRIAFASDRAGNGNWDIYTMGSDGSRLKRLTANAGLDDFPCWRW